MNNLNINSETANFGFEANQNVTIKFIGGTYSQKHNNPCTVTVPFSSFSRRLQSIQRSGGKITHVSIPRLQPVAPNLSAHESKLDIEPVSEPVAIAEIAIAPEPAIELIPEPVPSIATAKSKKPKTSTKAKSGSGFNKPKG